VVVVLTRLAITLAVAMKATLEPIAKTKILAVRNA
jgi:hypothetical protein